VTSALGQTTTPATCRCLVSWGRSGAAVRRASTVNFGESAVFIDASRDPIATRQFDKFVTGVNISIEPVTEIQARITREAYRDFGRGSGHPEKLNFGDCFAYALARTSGEPLLFKSNDLVHTDITSALPAEP
jgi:ribonuclease VapC